MTDPQAIPVQPIVTNWEIVAGTVLAIALGKVYDARWLQPKVKAERNREVDMVRNAIDLAQQSNVLEFGKIGTRLDKVDGSMEVVKSEVTGLRTRELDRLEIASRRRKR